MSKEVNNSNRKVNIARELTRKQIFDCAMIFIAFGVNFYFVKILGYVSYDLITVSTISLIILFFAFEYSKNAVQTPLNNLVIDALDETLSSVNSIQDKNNFQKENNITSNDRIKSVKDLMINLKKYSDEMAELTDKTREKTDQSISFTNNEYSAVKANIEKMFSIRHKIQTIAELILELSDFVQSISSTIGLVEDIAEQTNLLALNAAVEAARAGEHGKGFAVVASEIRKLADESKQATTKIISLINDIQQTANSTVLATEEGTKEIESGLELAHTISENIEQLISAMNEISKNMNEIIISSSQISNDSRTTDGFIEEISQYVEQSQKITNENEEMVSKIQSTSNNLKQQVL